MATLEETRAKLEEKQKQLADIFEQAKAKGLGKYLWSLGMGTVKLFIASQFALAPSRGAPPSRANVCVGPPLSARSPNRIVVLSKPNPNPQEASFE